MDHSEDSERKSNSATASQIARESMTLTERETVDREMTPTERAEDRLADAIQGNSELVSKLIRGIERVLVPHMDKPADGGDQAEKTASPLVKGIEAKTEVLQMNNYRLMDAIERLEI